MGAIKSRQNNGGSSGPDAAAHRACDISRAGARISGVGQSYPQPPPKQQAPEAQGGMSELTQAEGAVSPPRAGWAMSESWRVSSVLSQEGQAGESEARTSVWNSLPHALQVKP